MFQPRFRAGLFSVDMGYEGCLRRGLYLFKLQQPPTSLQFHERDVLKTIKPLQTASFTETDQLLSLVSALRPKAIKYTIVSEYVLRVSIQK